MIVGIPSILNSNKYLFKLLLINISIIFRIYYFKKSFNFFKIVINMKK